MRSASSDLFQGCSAITDEIVRAGRVASALLDLVACLLVPALLRRLACRKPQVMDIVVAHRALQVIVPMASLGRPAA